MHLSFENRVCNVGNFIQGEINFETAYNESKRKQIREIENPEGGRAVKAILLIGILLLLIVIVSAMLAIYTARKYQEQEEKHR